MPSVRQVVEAELLAYSETRNWQGELDGTAHIKSYAGVHNWRGNDDEVAEDALNAILQPHFERYVRSHGQASPLVERLIDQFESAPSIDSLVDVVEAMTRDLGEGARPA
jgi:hypothetical protein